MMKSRRGGERCVQNLSGNTKGRDNTEDLVIDGRMILKRILQKQDVRAWTGFVWFV
jgi:hypothetical protein